MAAAFKANVFVPLKKGSAGTWVLQVKKYIYIHVYWKEKDAAASEGKEKEGFVYASWC